MFFLYQLFQFPGLVPGDQQDALTLGIEGEQDAKLGSSGGAGTQFLHVFMSGCGHGVHEWSTEARAVLLKQLDRGDHLGLRVVIQ